jgi:hypothetical protein
VNTYEMPNERKWADFVDIQLAMPEQCPPDLLKAMFNVLLSVQIKN